MGEGLDNSELFGDEGGPESEIEGNQNIEAEQQQNAEESDQPTVIDTAGVIEQQGGNSPENSDEKPANKDGIKEIDGQLYVAVDSNNAELVSKNGKHQIPYEVLEKHRRGEQELKSQLEEVQQKLTGSETTQQKLKLFEEQLKEAGITPDRLPEELLNDPDSVNTIAEEVGGVAGQIIAALVAKNQANQQPAQEPNQSQSASLEEILALPELANLNSWFDSDKERWDMAVNIDAQLQSDPKWKSMSDAERFIEVQKLVEASFNDPVEAGAKKELADQGKSQGQQPNEAPQQQDVIPNSPSSLSGGGNNSTEAARQALANADALTLEDAMTGMSSDEIDELLEEASAAFD
ncbi:hypothetical protein HW45_03690 [Vibrio sp. ER1A]|nr:hypothetical protein HW45_03690 [Vibrio sp. ER1A]